MSFRCVKRFGLSVWIVVALILATVGPVLAQADPLEALGIAFREASEKAAPSVVQVVCERGRDLDGPGKTRTRTPFPVPPDVLERYQENRLRFVRPSGPASGVIIDSGGLILTSLYNVAGQIRNLRVVLADGRSYAAKVLGQDPNKDVVLLEIKASGLPALELSKDLSPVPGQFCLTLGRGADAGELNMNSGIISAVIRSRGDAIQTSARVNYANAGGALVDLDGRLLGVITKIGHDFERMRSGINTGVGFAAPAAGLAEILDTLKAGKNIALRPTPFLGILFDPSYPASADQKGVRIEYVYKEFPGAKAGLEPGDILVNFEFVDINIRNDLIYVIRQCDPGQKVTFSVLRGDEAIDLQGVLTKRPDPSQSAKMAHEYLMGKSPRALGIRVDPDYSGPGAFVNYVHEGFPLHDGGLRAGDVILGVHGLKDFQGWFPVFYIGYFSRALPYCFEGANVSFWVWRDGKERMIPLVIGRTASREKFTGMEEAFAEAEKTGDLPSPPGKRERDRIAEDIVRWKLNLHLGIRLGGLKPDGFEVEFVHDGFPGKAKGIKKGDLLVSLQALRVRRGTYWRTIQAGVVKAEALAKRLKFLAGDIPPNSAHWERGARWKVVVLSDGERREIEISLGGYPAPAALLALEGEYRRDFSLTARYGKALLAVVTNRSASGRIQALRALNTGANWSRQVAKSLVSLLDDTDRSFVGKVAEVLMGHPSAATFDYLVRALPVSEDDRNKKRWQDEKKLEVIEAFLRVADFPGEKPDHGLNGNLWRHWWNETRDRVRFGR